MVPPRLANSSLEWPRSRVRWRHLLHKMDKLNQLANLIATSNKQTNAKKQKEGPKVRVIQDRSDR